MFAFMLHVRWRTNSQDKSAQLQQLLLWWRDSLKSTLTGEIEKYENVKKWMTDWSRKKTEINPFNVQDINNYRPCDPASPDMLFKSLLQLSIH